MRSERLRLNPTYPLCWESVETLRIGFDAAQVRLHAPTPQEQRFVGKLRDGVSARDLPELAKKCGLSATEQRSLLQRLDGALERVQSSPAGSRTPSARSRNRAALDVQVFGEGEFASDIQRHLAHAGVTTAVTRVAKPGGTAPSEAEPAITAGFAIVIERFLGTAAVPHALLSNGVPHFPICLTDTGMFAGPLVPPGGSPCLACVELHRSDTEPLIAVLAAQITTVVPAAETPRSAELAASLALLAFRLWQSGATAEAAVRLRFPVRDGTPVFVPSAENISPHPECGCGLF